MKICTKCKKNKGLSDFYKTGKYYRSECKDCTNSDTLNRYFKKRKLKQRFCLVCGSEIGNYKYCEECKKIKKNKASKQDYLKNRTKISQYKKEWYKNKYEHIKRPLN
jgi:hypothetical protein